MSPSGRPTLLGLAGLGGPIDRGDDADQEIQLGAIAGLQTHRDSLWPDTGHVHGLLGVVREDVMNVVRQLAVDADRLHALFPAPNRSVTVPLVSMVRKVEKPAAWWRW